MGCVPNTLRGAGVWFGPDVTDNFLQRHRLSYVIRSHECKPNGHEFMHDNKVGLSFSLLYYPYKKSKSIRNIGKELLA